MPDIDTQQYLDWLALKAEKTPLGIGPSDVPGSGAKSDLIATKEHEILFFMANDSLGALLKACEIRDYSKSQIELLRLKSKEFDKRTTSFGIVGNDKVHLRRKQRDIRRRLLIALLSKHGYSPDDLKGSKIKVLLNLAESKGIL